MDKKIRTYSELIALPTFKERYEYLKLEGQVGVETFGWDRYLNQNFYKSYAWKQARRNVILRDSGCDLGCEDHPLYERVIIHHMNPISKKDIIEMTALLLDPEYLICTCKRTHDAIHFSDSSLLHEEYVPRQPGDLFVK